MKPRMCKIRIRCNRESWEDEDFEERTEDVQLKKGCMIKKNLGRIKKNSNYKANNKTAVGK